MNADAPFANIHASVFHSNFFDTHFAALCSRYYGEIRGDAAHVIPGEIAPRKQSRIAHAALFAAVYQRFFPVSMCRFFSVSMGNRFLVSPALPGVDCDQ
jgi:hypothetical protein